jgi:hypothetical protein
MHVTGMLGMIVASFADVFLTHSVGISLRSWKCPRQHRRAADLIDSSQAGM